jgi:hypothetical protein
MSPSELKYHVETANPDCCFFHRGTMRFFGDTMRNYGVRSVLVSSNFDENGNYHEDGVDREAWELYRKKPVKRGNKGSAFFCKSTFDEIHARVK